jgi:uncharacterized protein (DUF488 family)
MSNSTELKLPTASAKAQLQSKERWNASRSAEDADFFTLGYSGKSLEEISESLLRLGVRSLIDIRTNPVSMYRPEFSKNNLRNALASQGISYDHRPQFGVPRDIRAKSLQTGNRQVIWDWYDRHVANEYIGINLHRFFNTIEHPTVLMCSELDPLECHRHRLCLVLEKLGLRSYDI